MGPFMIFYKLGIKEGKTYLTDSPITFTLKTESVSKSKNTIFGLKAPKSQIQ